ncbi:hypothetical protein [Streptomyces sp. NBC_00286]|uniref:hypothetical protein n=1 Tax=Streptomyces sp. NBC_00286 TaxID=2975701 RepID=UPI002E2BBC7D|nr:hypothetical protein [Streptomyces sp. NBC_00286]
MELRSVDELMDLLHACRGAWGASAVPHRKPRQRGGSPAGSALDLHDHALQTAALLRRGHPSDKELQVAGLVHGIGQLLYPGDEARHADHAADAVRSLLGERVACLVRLRAAPWDDGPFDDDVLSLRQADEAGKVAGLNAGVLEDWRTVLELVAARATVRR